MIVRSGLDDNWQNCSSLDGQRSFHASDGSPLINYHTFPSLGAMTAHGHAKGLRVGWVRQPVRSLVCPQMLNISQRVCN